jgi:hypothetical protein
MSSAPFIDGKLDRRLAKLRQKQQCVKVFSMRVGEVVASGKERFSASIGEEWHFGALETLQNGLGMNSLDRTGNCPNHLEMADETEVP